MKKIEIKGIRYFIRDAVAEYHDVDNQSEIRLLKLSDFAIKDNQLIKCRHDLDYIIESFMERNCL